MTQDKIVAHYLDNRVIKGYSPDFMLGKDLFHLVLKDVPEGSDPFTVNVRELKAVFFVKHFMGNPKYRDKKEFDPNEPVKGRKIKVVFTDGEVFVGTSQDYQPGQPGFFVFPADPQSNIIRCFVVSASAQAVSFI